MPSLLASNAHLWLLNTMLSQIFLAVGTAVVEPTGAGKTGIINLAPFAALGPSAPPGSACKVLVVTPNIGELRAAAAAEHVSRHLTPMYMHNWCIECGASSSSSSMSDKDLAGMPLTCAAAFERRLRFHCMKHSVLLTWPGAHARSHPSPAVIAEGVYDSFSKASNKSCLRDVLRVVTHPELLPTAFKLSNLPGMASAEAAAAGRGGSSSSSATAGSRSNNTYSSAAAVAAAAAMPLELHDDEAAEDMFDAYDDDDMNEDLMNIAAAAWINAEAAAASPDVHSGSSGRTAAAAAGRPVPLQLQPLAAAHVVVANIQQLPQRKLEALFPRTYFDLVIMDEAHHAAARTWAAVLEYFAAAAKVSEHGQLSHMAWGSCLLQVLVTICCQYFQQSPGVGACTSKLFAHPSQMTSRSLHLNLAAPGAGAADCDTFQGRWGRLAAACAVWG